MRIRWTDLMSLNDGDVVLVPMTVKALGSRHGGSMVYVEGRMIGDDGQPCGSPVTISGSYNDKIRKLAEVGEEGA